MPDVEPQRVKKHEGSRRLIIGSSVISLLGITFGSGLIVAGSELTWRSDHILGIYNQSGWKFSNIASGDGKITMALGALMAVGFILGVLLQHKVPYGIALVADIIVGALSIYELIYLFTRTGVVGPGSGLYMVLGGSIAGFLCALGGYLMMAEKPVDGKEPEPRAEATA
jgi:hypothetical protein